MKKENWFKRCYDNITWFFIEIMKIYSSEDSYFSKKRIESGIAFIIAQFGMVYFLMEHHSTLTMGEFLLWSAAEFAVSGYIINKIQSEKAAAQKSESVESINEVL